MNMNERADRARIEALDVALDRELAKPAALVDARDALRDALERTLGNFRLMLSQKPVRDAAETIAEAERALAQQAPTPAAPSEAAAPVDARDALDALFDYCDESEAAHHGVLRLDIVRTMANHIRAALTRQAAAPAEGKT